MELAKYGNSYIHDLIYGGHIERRSNNVERSGIRFSKRLDFCHRLDFVERLKQKDKILSAADNDNAFYRDNQRVTVRRLRDFVDGWNPAVKDEWRVSRILRYRSPAG